MFIICWQWGHFMKFYVVHKASYGWHLSFMSIPLRIFIHIGLNIVCAWLCALIWVLFDIWIASLLVTHWNNDLKTYNTKFFRTTLTFLIDLLLEMIYNNVLLYVSSSPLHVFSHFNYYLYGVFNLVFYSRLSFFL